MMLRGLGCELDSREVIAGDLRDRHVARLVGDSGSYAPSRDWSPYLDGVFDQGNTNSCVAWALSTATYLAGAVSGRRILRPSIRHLYAISSWIDQPGKPISTGGRSPRRVAFAASEHGMVAEERWPFSVDRVAEPYPFDLDVAGADALLTGTYTLGGGDIPTQMRIALDRGHFPIAAIQVRESFDQYTSGLYMPNGLGRGWHMIAAVSYAPGYIRYANSWSRSWGDNGFVDVPDEVHRGPELGDALVATAAPMGLR